MYPFIHIAEGLEIPSFFLVISLVLSLSLIWVVRRSEIYKLPKKNVLDLGLLLMLSALVGARLMHVLYENLDYYQQNPLKVFYLWEGGFVFYGGLITAFLAAILYFRFMKIKNPGAYYDTFAPVLSFSYGFGRIGCFLAGCCYGRFCDLPWAVQSKHPTQLYALLWEVGSIALLLGIEHGGLQKRPRWLRRPGDLFAFWLVLYALGRMMMEHFREDFRGEALFGFSVSTVGSWMLLIASFSYLLSRSLRRP